MRKIKDFIQRLSPNKLLLIAIVIIIVISTFIFGGLAIHLRKKDVSDNQAASTVVDTTDSEVAAQAGVAVFFNGALVKVYDSKEDALASQGVDLTEISNDTNLLVQAVISYDQNIENVTAWIEAGDERGEEHVMSPENNWGVTLNLNEYSSSAVINVRIANTSDEYEWYFKLNIS